MLYDALALHVALVIVVDHNRKDHRKSDFVGEVSPFFPLCIDEGSFCSMPNHKRGTVAVTRQAPRATDGQALWEQLKHLQVGGCAISVGIRPLNGKATTTVMPCILLCGSFGGSPQPTTNPRDRVKKVEMTLCTFTLATFFTLWRSEVLVRQRNGKHREEKRCCGQNTKSGGSDPTFSAFSRPKSSWGRSRPPRAARGSVLSTCSRGAKSLSDTESDNL